MSDESAFLNTILDHPHDWGPRLVFADWLEESGDPRGELIRLLHELHQLGAVPQRTNKERRLRELIGTGVPPIGPYFTLRPIEMRFVMIPPGSFVMGSPVHEEGFRDNEAPQHGVTLTRGFFMSVDPVNQRQWRFVMQDNPSRYNDDATLPVENVTWDRCHEFCQKLSQQTRHDIRMPTEAEWEYACRAGTTSPFWFGPTLSTQQVNYNGNNVYGEGVKGVHRGRTNVPGTFPPNAWGVCDMHGNVWEWCQDGLRTFGAYAVVDPVGPSSEGESRVFRGGSFYDPPVLARSSHRYRLSQSSSAFNLGFRVVIIV